MPKPKKKQGLLRYFTSRGNSDIEFLVLLFFLIVISMSAVATYTGKIPSNFKSTTKVQPSPTPVKETIVLTLTLQKGTNWAPFAKWQLTNGLNWRGIESDVKDMEAAGIKWVRLALTENTEVNDRVINVLTEHKINPLIVLRGDPLNKKGNFIQRKFYTDKLKGIAKRYRENIAYYEVWSEPNNPAFWDINIADNSDPKKYEQSVAEYIERLKDTYTSVKKENPNAYIVLGGLAEEKMERWLTIFMNLEGYKYIDIVAFHPKATTPEGMILQIQRLKTKLAEVPDFASKPIWITEAGYTTEEDAVRNVIDEKAKAEYLTRAYKGIRDSRVYGPIFWQTFVEAEPSKAGYGLILKDNTTLTTTYLPAYEALKVLQ